MTTPSTTTYSRGDIVLVSFPFTDLTFTKQRPALVISPDTFNCLNGDLILAAVTSQLSPLPHSIPLMPEDCTNGTLPKASMVKLTKVFTLSAVLVRKRLCRLSEEKLKNVLAELRDLYS
jgi:mRNA interferase MazF